MSAGWVAGTVRARALARRRVGRAGARELAARRSLAEALDVLVATPYGHDVRAGSSLAEAQHQIGESLLWNVRVLAGWLPSEGGDALRALAAGAELADVDELLRSLAGSTGEPPYRLGSLATAWPILREATSVAELRERLGRSVWGDPGGDSPWHVQLTMRLVWADRIATLAPPAASWAAGGAALLVAREVLVRGRRLPPPPAAAGLSALRLLGPAAVAATELAGLAEALPAPASWVLEGVRDDEALWAAETRFWNRVETEAFRLARALRFGLEPVVGVVALLAVDAWRVRAALALAARGGGDGEVLDAVG